MVDVAPDNNNTQKRMEEHEAREAKKMAKRKAKALQKEQRAEERELKEAERERERAIEQESKENSVLSAKEMEEQERLADEQRLFAAEFLEEETVVLPAHHIKKSAADSNRLGGQHMC